MTDRAELRRRARLGLPVVRSDERAPISLADYKRRKELQVYEDRLAQIRRARREIDLQRVRNDRPLWLLVYLSALVLLVVVAIARSCSDSTPQEEATDGPPVSIQPGN